MLFHTEYNFFQLKKFSKVLSVLSYNPINGILQVITSILATPHTTDQSYVHTVCVLCHNDYYFSCHSQMRPIKISVVSTSMSLRRIMQSICE